MQMLQRFAWTVAIGMGATALVPAEVVRVEIDSGDWQRENSVITFRADSRIRELRDADGKIYPVQVDDAGRASFIVPGMQRGERKTYEVVRGREPAEAPNGVELKRDGTRLKATSDGRTILEYQAEPGALPRSNIDPIYLRGGYIHPVLSPSGRLVTDDYPSDHVHHHGIWWAWTKTEFQGRQPDFWNMGQGKGRVEFKGLDRSWSGPVHGGFRSRHQFVDLTAGEPKVALTETWEVRIYNVRQGARPYFMFDLESVQECATRDPLMLPKYHYGGLGVRGNGAWNGKQNTFFLTSEGETDRVQGNETRGRWCHISGEVNGKRTGLAILCHPDNFRAPQPMRLHPTEPFFCYAPSQMGDWAIEPGKPYVSRYRFVVFDGQPDREELDRLWNDYAHPVEASVVQR